jgi:hypothetical protein
MPYHLSHPLGNNAFSYDQRRQLGSDLTLVISDPCEITSLDQVQLGDFVVFEEIGGCLEFPLETVRNPFREKGGGCKPGDLHSCT